MGLFDKKRDVRELRLPEAPMVFPELPHEMSESSMPTLPRLQPVPMNSLPPLPQMSDSSMTMPSPRMPEPQLPSSQKNPMSRMMGNTNLAPQMEMSKMKEPIFIKIDKYREAMANFELIKKRLQETSSLLDKIKDTRKKEEEELNAWTQELDSMKLKIGSIDKKMFGSLE